MRAASGPGEEGEGYTVFTCTNMISRGTGRQFSRGQGTSRFAVPVTELGPEGRRGHFLTGRGISRTFSERPVEEAWCMGTKSGNTFFFFVNPRIFFH